MSHIKLAIKMFKASSCAGARAFYQDLPRGSQMIASELANKTIAQCLTDGMCSAAIKAGVVNAVTSANQLKPLSSIHHTTQRAIVEQLDLADANQEGFLEPLCAGCKHNPETYVVPARNNVWKTLCFSPPGPISEIVPKIEANTATLSKVDKKSIAKTADYSLKSDKKSNANEGYLRTKYYAGFNKGLYDIKYFHEAYQGFTNSGKVVQSGKNNIKENKK